MPDFEYRDYIFYIFLEDKCEGKIPYIIQSIRDIGFETISHTKGTNLVTTTAQIPDQHAYIVEERIQKLKKISNIVDVDVKRGNRHFFRSMHEDIGVNDNITAVVNRFGRSKEIKIEEIIYENNSQIQISAEDNSTVTVNQNIIINIDNNTRNIEPSNIVLGSLESLKSNLQENESLDEEVKENSIKLIDKIKTTLSKVPLGIDKHIVLLKWLVPNSTVAFFIVMEIIQLLTGG